MPSPSAAPTSDRSGPPRALVLCGAVILGFAVWSASQVPSAGAQESKAPQTAPAVPTPPTPPEPPAKPKADTGKVVKSIGPIGITIETDSKDGAKADEADEEVKDTKDSKGARTIIVKKDGKTVRITGIPNDDDEIDTLGEIGKMDPALASMVVGIVAVVFFAPVIAIALIVWYRMRKTRMQNELALKLAERGIVATPEALGAIGGSAAAAPGPIAAVGDKLVDARRRSTASSDLRKGVVMTAIGLAITVYTGGGGHPNIFGLILLFVGIGYGVLWWFEQRPQQRAAAGYGEGYGNQASIAPPPPPPVAGSNPNDRGSAG